MFIFTGRGGKEKGIKAISRKQVEKNMLSQQNATHRQSQMLLHSVGGRREIEKVVETVV